MAQQPPKSAADKASGSARKSVRQRSRANAADGAGNPSRDTRFQPGQSGNPNGRPRKDRSLLKLIEAELDAEMQVTEGGNALRLTKREALAKSMVNNALKGDQRALNNLLKQLPAPKHDDSDDFAQVPLEAILNFLLRKGPNPGGGEMDND
ncbi:MAG: DUF5681 domain-containing protein [Sphingobium sp.]|jgi:hypothetical protein|nr:DUF5681 domain-containing protein [Sphingobium sp.]